MISEHVLHETGGQPPPLASGPTQATAWPGLAWVGQGWPSTLSILQSILGLFFSTQFPL